MPQVTIFSATMGNFFIDPARVSGDESYWVAFCREYAIPGIIFIGLLYYLTMHVCIPLRNIRVVRVDKKNEQVK
ncbi:unnamed protein product [Phytomonas sp. EM1]|nr:unnamed protein product [Phytomonas sp. EM1]|eukprot:CCW65033.1 unnamed protein product [Phytomonas sp. isolate EM1]